MLSARASAVQSVRGDVRQRNGTTSEPSHGDENTPSNLDDKLENEKEEATWGRTPSGVGEFNLHDIKAAFIKAAYREGVAESPDSGTDC